MEDLVLASAERHLNGNIKSAELREAKAVIISSNAGWPLLRLGKHSSLAGCLGPLIHCYYLAAGKIPCHLSGDRKCCAFKGQTIERLHGQRVWKQESSSPWNLLCFSGHGWVRTTDTVEQCLWASASSSLLLIPTAQKVGHLLSGSKQMKIAVEKTKKDGRGYLTPNN